MSSSSSSTPQSKSQSQSPASHEESAKAVADGLSLLIKHTKKDIARKKEPPCLSHYRVLPSNLQTAYALLQQGATLVRATATKYALVGAIDRTDQGSLGTDLLKGCELIGAAAHVTMPDANGCSRALREFTHKAALSIFVATLRLVEAFCPRPQVAAGQSNKSIVVVVEAASKENNVGARRTGAVWEACDHVLNKMLPRGNRNAMRREIFTLTRECNDTMEEFEELVEMGPREEKTEPNVEEEDDDDDDFFGGGDEQYSEEELPMARACLALLKNSRGNMKVALEACEALGRLEQEDGENDKEHHLAAILAIHGYSKTVGEGVTDLGSLLYPPLQPSELRDGVLQQVGSILEFQNYLLGLRQPLPSTVTDLSRTLKTAAETRQQDFLDALERYRSIE